MSVHQLWHQPLRHQTLERTKEDSASRIVSTQWILDIISKCQAHSDTIRTDFVPCPLVTLSLVEEMGDRTGNPSSGLRGPDFQGDNVDSGGGGNRLNITLSKTCVLSETRRGACPSILDCLLSSLSVGGNVNSSPSLGLYHPNDSEH